LTEKLGVISLMCLAHVTRKKQESRAAARDARCRIYVKYSADHGLIGLKFAMHSL